MFLYTYLQYAVNVFYDAEYTVQHLWDQNNAMFGAKYLTELPESLYYPNVNI